MPRLTAEDKARIKARHEEWLKNHYSVEYQLGIYIGEHIVAKYLPTLSIDWIKSNNVIQVSEEDALVEARLDKIYSDKRGWGEENKDKANREWNEWLTYRKILQEKYLPSVLECYVDYIQVSVDKIHDLKKGIERALWDCDMCYYNCSPDDIKMEHEEYHTILRFPLDKRIHLLEVKDEKEN